MKRTIYDCWQCRHHNSDNPYGIDYCDVHDTRCSFAHDDCENFESDSNTDGNDIQPEPPRRLTVIGWYLLIITALLAWLLIGCTTTKYVPMVEHRTDTLLEYSSIRDSIYVHDSIHVSDKGDTVCIERWHTRWRDRWQYDTVYISKTDSVPTPYPVEVEVPAPLTWWQNTRLHLANIVLLTLGLWVVGRIWKRHWH